MLNSNLDSYVLFPEIYDSVMNHIDFNVWATFIQNSIFPNLPKNILDLACGTGKLLNEFPNSIEKSGIDSSEKMLEIGRKNYKNISFSNADLKKFKLDNKFELITCTHDSLNYLKSIYEIEDHFNSVQDSLEGNGFYFFDLSSEFNLTNNFDKKVFRENHGQFNLIWRNSYDQYSKQIISNLEFEWKEEGEIKSFIERHVQYFYSITEIEKILKKTGFELLRIGSDYKSWKPKKDASLITFLVKKK